MPFDYNSFMQGVITGLKLGRVPKGRTPPTPSGRYILTESGEMVLTELGTLSDVTIIDSKTWYQADFPEDREIWLYRAYPDWIEPGHTAIGIVASGLLTQGYDVPVFTWVFKTIDRPYVAVMLTRYVDPPGEESRHSSALRIQALGDGYEVGQLSSAPLPYALKGVTPFVGTKNDLLYWIEHLQSYPLITE